MDIVFKCTNCKQELEVDSGAAGQQINCPSCNKSIAIPQADPTNLRVGNAAAAANAANREAKNLAVPLSDRPVQSLIHKPLPSLETAAKEDASGLRIKTIRHSDCKEVGHDNFDKIATETLQKIGEDKIVSINTFSYTYTDLATRAQLTDFGILVVHKA